MSALDRAELYATDHRGERIRKSKREHMDVLCSSCSTKRSACIGECCDDCWHPEEIPVRETPRHALSNANTEENEMQQEYEVKEREARMMFDALEPMDRELLRLSLTKFPGRERQLPYPASMRRHYEQAGWLFVRYENHGRIARMAKSFPGHLTHSEIGERLNLSVWQVRRRLNAMSPSMVKCAEMRGWL
jgi:hypothetical protein